MIRTLTNKIRGRILFLDKQLKFDDAKNLIGKLEDHLVIEYEHVDFVHSDIIRGKTYPRQAQQLIEEIFIRQKTEYFDARIQIYMNGSTEKHYLDFWKGIFIDMGNGKMNKSGPIVQLSTEYFIKK